MPGHNPLALNQTIFESEGTGGFMRDYPLPLGSFRLATGLIMTGATNPLIGAAVSSCIPIQWAAADSTALLVQASLPGEYDSASEVEKFQLVLAVNNLDVASTIDATAQLIRAGTAITTAVASDGAQTLTAADATGVTQLVKITWSRTPTQAKRFRAGDGIQFLITPGTHASAAINLFGAILRVRVNACLTDKTLRR